MKTKLLMVLIATILTACSIYKVKEGVNYVQYVDPMVGTSWKSNAGLVPAVTAPFGMVQFTAATDVNKIGMSAYHYENGKILGFMASHQPAPWMGDYGYLTMWPAFDTIKLKQNERALTFSHENENSGPSHYSVKLEGTDSTQWVNTEFTATQRCGFFRFEFSENINPSLVFEFSRQKGLETRMVDFNAKPQKHIDYIYQNRKDNFEGFVKIDDHKKEITGYNPDRHSYHLGPVLKNFRGYFVIQFDTDFLNFGTWKDSVVSNNNTEQSAEHVGAYISFAKGANVKVKVGTSFISIEQARQNLSNELPSWDFESVKQQLTDDWNKRLGVIELVKATVEQKRIFYTALYHSMIYPRIFSEYGKYYSAFDDTIHNGVSYNDFSLWDTFRALHPLLIFTAPKEVPDMITALCNMYKEGGFIPKWPNPAYTNIMIGTHADAVIADAFAKGVEGFDKELAYEAIRKNAFTPPDFDLDSTQWDLSPWKHYEKTPKTSANPWWDRSVFKAYEARAGLTFYDSLGYVPQDKTRESVSRTLEFAYDDFCVAQVAQSLGKTSDYEYLIKRSKNYKNLYNPQTGLMAIKNSRGEWMADSLELDKHIGPESFLGFTEGDPYTYQFCVMHDIPGLINLMGGKSSFVKRLDFVFNAGHYEHTNEPCHHYPYLYSYAGQAQTTQQKVRQYTLSQYNTGPSGIMGNDDCGQMSAWFVFSSLGFYPVCPGKDEYVIGSPLFEEAIIHLSNGKQFRIKTKNNANENCLIESMTLNGKSYNNLFLKHSDIMGGGEMIFQMRK